VQISGIPEAELTPRVRQALMALLAEIDQLRRDLTDARGRIDFLERLADEDPLIPIANRRAFLREVTRMIGFGQRYGTPASIVYIDVNHLKTINDSYGHAAGDAALMQVSRTLVEQVRNTDVVARLGGDEFGVLMVQADRAVAEGKAAQLAEAVRQRPLSPKLDGGSISLRLRELDEGVVDSIKMRRHCRRGRIRVAIEDRFIDRAMLCQGTTTTVRDRGGSERMCFQYAPQILNQLHRERVSAGLRDRDMEIGV